MILFIHGFGSCGWGEKSLLLRRHFGIRHVLAPDLPFQPLDAIRHLEGLLQRYPVRALVGSSLGGFFATWLNRHADYPSVLLNPVVHPQGLLAHYLGPQRRWCDAMPFTVGEGYLAQLQRLDRATIGAEERYLVLLQQGDEVLDYRQAAAYYRDKRPQLIDGGTHRFEDFHRQLPLIDDWIRANPSRHAEKN